MKYSYRIIQLSHLLKYNSAGSIVVKMILITINYLSINQQDTIKVATAVMWINTAYNQSYT